jgi:hypothetical protein
MLWFLLAKLNDIIWVLSRKCHGAEHAEFWCKAVTVDQTRRTTREIVATQRFSDTRSLPVSDQNRESLDAAGHFHCTSWVLERWRDRLGPVRS